MPPICKPISTSSFFPEEFRLDKLSKQGDPLEPLNKVVDWEYFRDMVRKALHTGKMANAGPKPYDPLLMFKMLILQRYFGMAMLWRNLSDEHR